MSRSRNKHLSVGFLHELYATAMQHESVCSLIAQHMEDSFLPSRALQGINKTLANHYIKNKTLPSIGIMSEGCKEYESDEEFQKIQKANSDRPDEIIELFVKYIKDVKLIEAYKKVGELFNKSMGEKAQDVFAEYAEWNAGFNIDNDGFTDVGETFTSRFKQNRKAFNDSKNSKLSLVSRFNICELDVMNEGRDLRKQLTCILAATGVGKSHAARHFGASSSLNGLNVLHFQLEGSESEVLDAYSGAFVQRNSFQFERGTYSDIEVKSMLKVLERHTGSVVVKSFPRFNNQVSTIDIKNNIAAYKKKYGYNPDIVIIDSMDLLTDSSRQSWSADNERKKRISVANDLKDLAGDENVWMIATYQATIENRDWLNDEKNVLTEYNCSEAKGLARPCTHLISLNQSDSERKENTMRLFVAKSRFFKKTDPIKIAIDYDNEVFYDKQRTMSMSIAGY